MDIFYVLMGLTGLLILGSLALRIANRKKAELIFSSIMLLLMLGAIFYMRNGPAHILRNIFSINPFSLFFALLFTSALFLVNILASEFTMRYTDFALLSGFAILGMYLVAFSTSLLTIFIGLELASIPTVFMVLLSEKGLEAATKLFIITSLAISLLSFSIVLVYGGANSLALASYSQNSLLLFASLLFIVSLGLEASIFPFNVFIPDIYQGSPAYLTAMLGGVNKKVAFAALIQILIISFIGYKETFLIFAILSALTMFYGNIVAILQSNFKRMLAYSSISQAGYIMIGIAAQSASGISASLFQIFAHMFAFIGLLGIVAWLENHNREKIEDLTGLHNENGLAAFSIALFMLAFVGLPLTTGFIGKFLLFLSAVNSNLFWLAVLGIVNSIISIYYYSKVIIAAYSKESNESNQKSVSLGGKLTFVVLVTLILTLLFGIYPQPLISLTGNAGSYLFGNVLPGLG